VPALARFFGAFPYAHETEMSFLKFAPVFMTGALLYIYRERIPDSGPLALASAGVFIASLWLPSGPPTAVPEHYLAASGLLLPFIVYPLLWLGLHLPLQKVASKNDYSYGTYIYAWPITQVLVAWDAYRWGFLPFLGLVLLGTAPFAVGSWWLIERRALRRKDLSLKRIRWLAVSARRPGAADATIE